MSAAIYELRLFDTVLSHGLWKRRPRLLHDYDDYAARVDAAAEVDALVASGDCFITLATSVEKNADLLTADTATVAPGLAKLTNTLLYLQRHYHVTRKTTPNYRQ